jgi:hypothetical protein
VHEDYSDATTRTTVTLQREVPEGRKSSSVLLGGDGYKRAKYIHNSAMYIYCIYHKFLLLIFPTGVS